MNSDREQQIVSGKLVRGGWWWRASIWAVLLFCVVSPAHAVLEYDEKVIRKVIAGDMLQVTVEEQSSLNGTYGVGSDGSISFGELGRASVAERTVPEAELAIKKYLESKYFRQATVSVSIAEYVEGEVILMGALGSAGSDRGLREGGGILAAGSVKKIPVADGQLLSLFDVILSAGGLSPNANGKEVMIMRWRPGTGLQREIFTVDVDSIFRNFAWENDQFLRPRDIVYVPFLSGDDIEGEILVMGAGGGNGYRRWYEGMNVLRLVATMGGVGGEARNARILRPDGAEGYNVIPVDVQRLLGIADMSQNRDLRPGDIFYIPQEGMEASGEAWLMGEVAKPGPVIIPPRGEVTVARLLFMRGTTQFANLKKVQIVRKDPQGEEQTIEVNVKSILDEARWEDDVPVQDGDRIIVKEAILPIFTQ